MNEPDWRALVRDALSRITDDPAHDADIVDELAGHLASRFAEQLGRGVDRVTAVERAIAELDDPASLAASLRSVVPIRRQAPPPPIVGGSPKMWHDLVQDIRYGARLLVHAPGFTAAAVLTLALGIGATTGIFSVVNTVLLRPVPFSGVDRLAMIWETDRNTGTIREPASLPDFLDLQARSRQVAAFGAFIASEATLTPVGGEPSRLPIVLASHELLPLLGIRPLAGRVFAADEDRPASPPLALISDRLWEREFRRGADVVGRTIRLNDQEVEIIGVLPSDADFGTMQILRGAAYGRGFADRDLHSRVDVWLSLRGDPQQLVRDTHPLLVVGRLAPSATVAAAQAELAGIMSDLEAQYPSNTARGVFIESMPDVIFARVRGTLWVLLVAVGFVLLIACVNVANLLLARGTTRLREVAVRTAIGAPTGRLARQFAAENLVLTMTGAALGVGIAVAALRVLGSLAPADIPRVSESGIDGTVLSVAAILAVVTGLMFGLVPVLQARRLDLQASLKAEDSRGGTAGRPRSTLRSLLVTSEVALAVVLVIGAGLLLKSAWRLSQVDAGFHAEGVLKAEFQLPPSRYRSRQERWPDFVLMRAFNGELTRRVAGLPGVTAVAVVGNHPVDPGSQNSWRVVGREDEGRNWPEIAVRRVSAGYFATVSLAVRSGRPFADADGAQAPPVSMINETTARRFFQGSDPVGQQIRLWGASRTIVGVVADERIHGLSQEAPPAMYLPYDQAPSFNGAEALLVRASGAPSAVAASLRATVGEIDPQLAVFGIQTLSDAVADSVAQQRFVLLLLVTFAAVALVLAAIGIHGVLSYAVAQRRHELGIRMALGAPTGRLTRLVLGQGARLTVAGLAVGLVAAIGLTRVLSSQLYGVSATDLTTFVAVLPVLGAVALLATWLPARRALRIDPVEAMRDG